MASTPSKTIESLLGLPYLAGLVEETLSGLPQETFLPKGFKTVSRNIIGNSAQATLVRGQRKVSRLIQYSAAPVGASLETIGQSQWILFHSSEVMDIDPVTFQRLRNYDSWTEQEKGIEEIGRQVGLFVDKFANLQSTMTLMTLMNGVIYFDQYGNLLPSSSGAVNPSETILIPSGNQNQLNFDGGGNIISAPWSTPTTNIPLQIRKIMKASLKLTGRKPTQVFYGENVPGYIQINSYVKDYLTHYPAMNSVLANTGEIPDGFLNLKWVPAYEAFYEDSGTTGTPAGTGVNQSFVNADAATFCPEPDKSWYELLMGSMPIPRTIDIQTSAEAAIANLETKYGQFVYAQLQTMPTRLVTCGGHTFLPTIKNPPIVFQGIVSF